MTPQIIMVLAILGAAVLLFVTEKIRVDLVALMVLVSLALTGLVTPVEAVSGFANPAVITVWAVLILSAGLARTGVAGLIGRPMLNLSGGSEARLIALIMIVVAVLSGFMNNIGVAALMLPVVVDIARRTGHAPSRLLMPLAFASLLGGLTTLIGTPPNILVSEAQHQFGLEAFRMFDYTPTGVVVMVVGIVFIVLVGRHLLPKRDIKNITDENQDEPDEIFDLQERMFVVRLPWGSFLAGKTLKQSRLGAILGLNVLAILRKDQNILAPEADVSLHSGDRLLVEGLTDPLKAMIEGPLLVPEEDDLGPEDLLTSEIGLVEVGIPTNLGLQGKTLNQINFRNRFGVVVLAVRRGDGVIRTNLEKLPLHQDDVLLIQGTREQLDAFQEKSGFPSSESPVFDDYKLDERLLLVRVPPVSALVGKTLVESRLGDAYGLGVMGIVREGVTYMIPSPDEVLEAGDELLIKGQPDDLLILKGLRTLEIEEQPLPDLSELESAEVGLAEIVLSPHTSMVGKTIRQIHFRAKFGLSVLAVWRGGRLYRTNLRDMTLRFGDALLIYGRRDRLQILGKEPDFLVLTEDAQEAPRLRKAPISILIMAAVLIPVILDILPIAIAALAGVVLMILAGCLTMDEAYRAIEWKAIFLIAGMLPLGVAMENTGAANTLAEGMVGLVGPLGPLAVTAGIFILTALASQVMPNAAVAVLLTPIALNTANDLGISPYPLLMTVAISASAAFLSPVGHPSNILVMGPGGYKFSDYLKVGIPLTLVVLGIVLLVLPVFWPF